MICSDRMSPGNHDGISSKPIESGDIGHTGDISHIIIEEDYKTTNIKETAGSDIDQMIGFREPFYYCKQHPHVQNIHRRDRTPYSIFQIACWKLGKTSPHSKMAY